VDASMSFHVYHDVQDYALPTSFSLKIEYAAAKAVHPDAFNRNRPAEGGHQSQPTIALQFE
jgi:hypothetical protein